MPHSSTRRFVGLDAWKADARAEKAGADVALRKSYAGVFKADGDAPTAQIRIRITTAQRDRDHDTVAAAGWRLDNYLKNPVVLWAHDYRALPIARDIGLTVDAEGITGTPVFATADENPHAVYCERMIRGGFLNAASVGFAPVKWSFNEEERGMDFLEAELLEYSIVPIPANPGALIEARGAGIEIAWIAEWAEKALDEWHGGAGMWVPRQSIEEARTIAGRKGLVMLVPKGNTASWDVLALKADEPPADEEEEKDDEDEEEKDGDEDSSDEGSSDDDAEKEGDDDEIVIEAEDEEDEETLTLEDDDDEEEKDEGEDEDDSKTITIGAAELRGLVQDCIKDSLGPALTALTGRID